MAIQTVTINVEAQPTADRIQTFLVLSQNENGRQIRFRVLGDELPAGCTATLSGEKPDGNVWSKAGTVSDNFVTVDEDIQMTAVAGRWDAQLDIVHGLENIVTAPIRITIEPASVDAGAVPSDTQLEGYVEQCKQYAETAKDEAYGSPLTAATAAAMTDQRRVYVYTGSETGYTNGHWYYHNGSAWTDGGVYNAVAVDTDTTLSIAGKAADAKKTGDELNTIKEDLSKLKGTLDNLITEDVSENLFNKDDVITGYYFYMNATPSASGYSRGDLVPNSGTSVAYVPINGVGDYSFLNARSQIGASNAKSILLFDENKAYLSIVTGTLDADNNDITHLTIANSDLSNGAMYFGYIVENINLAEAMIVKSDTYPTEYIPYYNHGYIINGDVSVNRVVGLSDYVDSELAPIEGDVENLKARTEEGVTPEDTTFIDVSEPSANLFNKDEAISGYYFYPNASGGDYVRGDLYPKSTFSIAYIPINGAGDYSWFNAKSEFGVNGAKIVPLYNANKEYVSYINGTLDVDNNEITHFTVTEQKIADGAVYLGYSVKNTTIGSAMAVKSSIYPSEYIPYAPQSYFLSSEIKVPQSCIATASENILYGKKVVFDGDSICHAPSTGGWARFIGEKNGMDWYNVGVSGGTITSGVYYASGGARHWVSSYIDTIHTNHPTLDYLILEGGTNDADLLTNEQLGEMTYANYGNLANFDDTLYIGALESMFLKALTYYPTAKIGFIVAHKMGLAPGFGYESGDSPGTRRRRKFFDIAIDVCKKWGISYIDLWESAPLCPRINAYYDTSMTAEENRDAGKAYTDGQHLTQVGYDIISPKIEAWMRTL